jgi:tetratricopeptide (TPR) repeat protein
VLTFGEATSAHWLCRELCRFVDESIVCNPYHSRLLGEGPKTDRLDTIEQMGIIETCDYTNILLGLSLSQNEKPDEFYLKNLKKGLDKIDVAELDSRLSAEIANTLWRAQKTDEAVKYYELSLKKDPDQLDLLDQLAHIYLHRLGRRNEAISLAKSILKIEPNHLFALQITNGN